MISKWLILALISIESKGNDLAVGENGEVGCLQITQAVVVDVNRICGSEVFTPADRASRAKSIIMARIYIGHCCSPKRLGRFPTDEDFARCWKGGENFYRPENLARTEDYWLRVKHFLDDQNQGEAR